MDDLEARVRCLELAAQLALPDRNVISVVEIATRLYTFTQPSPVTESDPVADKSKRTKRPPVADIMS